MLVLLLAGPAQALDLSQCDRVTHVSHGGEDMHRDLGEGRVMWRDWWSQEGTATDYIIQDCGPGEALTLRTAEDNMGDRPPFDRTEAVLKVLDRHQRGARVFATLQRMADDLDRIARGVRVATSQQESCACAALYSDLRGEKAKFELSQ
ncbi:MAG: hypothetical protein AAF280_06115 [Pseudomonadota bacterium]